MNDTNDIETTKRAEVTAIVEGPRDLQEWFDEVQQEFLDGSPLPNSVTISIEWES